MLKKEMTSLLLVSIPTHVNLPSTVRPQGPLNMFVRGAGAQMPGDRTVFICWEACRRTS